MWILKCTHQTSFAVPSVRQDVHSTHPALISRRHCNIRISGDRDSHTLIAPLVSNIQPVGGGCSPALDGLDSAGTQTASPGELSCSLVQGSTVRRLTVPFQTALRGEGVKIGRPFPRRLKPSRQLQPERSVSSSTGTVSSALASKDTDMRTRLTLTMLTLLKKRTTQTNINPRATGTINMLALCTVCIS